MTYGLPPVCDHYYLFERLLRERQGIAGDIAEFGVYNGGSTRQLATLAPQRTVWAFDTFEGMPSAEFSAVLGDHDEPGKFRPDRSPEALFEGYPNIHAVEGRFSNTLQFVPDGTRFMLVYLDCDLYISTKQVLNWLHLGKHLAAGTVIVCDDYRDCAGARAAINEFLEKTGAAWDAEDSLILWGGCGR